MKSETVANEDNVYREMTLAEWQASCVPMPPFQFATKEQIAQFKAICNVRAFVKGLIMLKGLTNGNRE